MRATFEVIGAVLLHKKLLVVVTLCGVASGNRRFDSLTG
jgi:hypothetical protein